MEVTKSCLNPKNTRYGGGSVILGLCGSPKTKTRTRRRENRNRTRGYRTSEAIAIYIHLRPILEVMHLNLRFDASLLLTQSNFIKSRLYQWMCDTIVIMQQNLLPMLVLNISYRYDNAIMTFHCGEGDGSRTIRYLID